MNTYSLEQLPEAGNRVAILILRECDLDLMPRFLEIK